MDVHVDMAMLGELREIMEEDFNILIETYLEDSKTRLIAINEAFNEKDSEALRGAAHSFKGSSSNVGAIFLADLCKTVEDLGREGRVDDAQGLLNKIDAEFVSVKKIMASQLLH